MNLCGLIQIKNGIVRKGESGDRPEWGADGRGDTVSFGVEVVADHHRVAWLALVVVFVHRRFEEERVLALGSAHLLNTVDNGRHQHPWRTAHEVPHLLVYRDLRVLSSFAKNTLST